MGRAFKRNGHWSIYYYAKGDRVESVARALGIPPEKVTRQDAERLLRRRLAEKARGEIVALPDTRLTVAEILDAYEAHLEIGGAKMGPMRSLLRAVKRWLGDRRVQALTLHALEEAAAQALRIWKPGTVQTRLYGLRAACVLAKRHQRLAHVPDFPTITVRNARQGFFERPNFDRIHAYLRDPVNDLMLAVYLTGWRSSEIMTLTWDNIDRVEGSIRIYDSKTGQKVRPYAEDPELRAVIERRHAIRALGCPFVFHRRGRPVRDFSKAWDRARRKAGFPAAIPHDCRRTAYRDLFAAGVDPFTAMGLVGHTSLTTVKRYNIVDLARMRGGLTRLDAARHPDVSPTRARSRGRKGQA